MKSSRTRRWRSNLRPARFLDGTRLQLRQAGKGNEHMHGQLQLPLHIYRAVPGRLRLRLTSFDSALQLQRLGETNDGAVLLGLQEAPSRDGRLRRRRCRCRQQACAGRRRRRRDLCLHVVSVHIPQRHRCVPARGIATAAIRRLLGAHQRRTDFRRPASASASASPADAVARWRQRRAAAVPAQAFPRGVGPARRPARALHRRKALDGHRPGPSPEPAADPERRRHPAPPPAPDPRRAPRRQPLLPPRPSPETETEVRQAEEEAAAAAGGARTAERRRRRGLLQERRR